MERAMKIDTQFMLFNVGKLRIQNIHQANLKINIYPNNLLRKKLGKERIKQNCLLEYRYTWRGKLGEDVKLTVL